MSYQELLGLVNNFSKVAVYMINIKYRIVSLYLSNEQLENKIKKKKKLYNCIRKSKFPEINVKQNAKLRSG